MAFSRRHFLFSAAGATCLAAFPRVSSAVLGGVNPGKKLVFVHLDGGMDQLSALIPYKDPGYYGKYRAGTSFGKQGDSGSVIPVNDRLGLHPDFINLGAIVNGSGGGVRFISGFGVDNPERSHFVGMSIIARGLSGSTFTDPEVGLLPEFQTGFLGRLASHIAADDDSVPGYEITHASNEIFKFGEKKSVMITPPSDGELNQMSVLRLINSFTENVNTPLYEKTLSDIDVIETHLSSLTDEDRELFARGYSEDAEGKFSIISELMSQPEGANLIFTDLGGFDTHGSLKGRMPKLILDVDTAIGVLKDSPGWEDTIAVFFSEFGRRMTRNGSGGSDHGSGGLAIVIGGGLSGASVMNDEYWATDLADNRFERGDLPVQTDYRAVFKGILGSHLGVETSLLEEIVFPRSAEFTPITM